jgi:xylosylprotein 4-beta-galactosyltransferase
LEQSGKRGAEHHLCILVPFRDRWEELLEFAPHMQRFLADQQISFEIWVLNQADELR